MTTTSTMLVRVIFFTSDAEFLNDELCVRFGFCGEEYDAILSQVKQRGRAEVRF